MKKLYSIVAIAAMGAFVNAQKTVDFVAANQGWANAEVLSGTYAIDANLDLTTNKGTSNTAPAYYTSGSAMRIYTYGSYFTITPKNGAVITSITVKCVPNYSPAAKYIVDGGAETDMTATSDAYTINNINAATSLSVKNTDTKTQMRVTSISVTYNEGAAMATLETEASKFSFVKNTVVSDEIEFSKAADVKVFSVNGQLVKSADKVEKLNVASLAKGIYIVTGTVNGKNYSQKIVKK